MSTNKYVLPATLNKENVAFVLKDITNQADSDKIKIDCSNVISIDSAGIAMLLQMKYKANNLININDQILTICHLYHIDL